MSNLRLKEAVDDFERDLTHHSVTTPPSPPPTPVTWYQHNDILQRALSGINDEDTRKKYKGPFEALLNGREFSRVVVSKDSTGKEAYEIYERKFSDLTFHKVSMVELKYELFLASKKLITNKEQDSMLDTFFSTIPVLSHIDRRFIGVADSLYWDTHTASLKSSTSENRCFIRLFDTPPDKAVGGIQAFPRSIFDKTFSESITAQYDELVSRLRSLAPLSFDDITTLSPSKNLQFIMEWADDDQGLYWDIVTMFATFFMWKKPLGAYFLIGLTRNGKSSAVALINTLMGYTNVGGVCLSLLGDYHQSATLRYVLVNAPDDEDDDITRYQKDFKQLAGHKTIRVNKMRSQEPFDVPGNQFTMVFPMNTIPAWKGSSASACNKRTIIIPFNRDFSKSDKAIGNFEAKAFTPDALCTLAAHAMALASLFTAKPELFGYSSAVRAQLEASDAENNSVSLYATAFHKYFEGFSDWNLLYSDYQLWCNAHDVKFAKKNTLVLAFQQYRGEKCRTNQVYDTKTGTNSQKARHIRMGQKKRLLMPDAYYKELGRTAKELIDDSGQSVVAMLDAYIESRTEWMKREDDDGAR